MVFEDQQLTYRELNKRANQLAHYLRKLGVGPEVLVGHLCGTIVGDDRGDFRDSQSRRSLCAAGSNYPKERLAFMLEDSRAPVLITQKFLDESCPLTTQQFFVWIETGKK